MLKSRYRNNMANAFDFGAQFLYADETTYRGKRMDANFRIENAGVEWSERRAPVYKVARLTLNPCSLLSLSESETSYFDVSGNVTADSTPVGSINRARWRAKLASRQARMCEKTGLSSCDIRDGRAPPTKIQKKGE